VTEETRQILEAVETPGYHERTFIERIYDLGFAKGFAKGFTEARIATILKVLDRQGLASSPDQRERVTSCTDLARLEIWFERAITAAGAAEVFAD
jgi:hypothetical protein